MAYKIGSFNMHKLGENKSGESLEMIAMILNEESFDIIAMQEVFSAEPIRALSQKLTGKWDYRCAIPRFSGDGEGYAFMWNTNTMELSYSNEVKNVEDLLSVETRPVEPHIFEKYKKDKSLGQYELARSPYYGRFKPKGCFCEFRLINTHIRFGADDETHYSREGEIKETEQRKNEFRILADIYHTISDRRYGNQMPAYTILLGDYNLNLNRTWTKSPYVPYTDNPDKDVYIVKDVNANKRILTVQESLTTLRRDTSETGGNVESKIYANNYDHFSYDMDRFVEIDVKAERVDAVRTIENDPEKYRKAVSDHLPIRMNVNLNTKQ